MYYWRLGWQPMVVNAKKTPPWLVICAVNDNSYKLIYIPVHFPGAYDIISNQLERKAKRGALTAS